MFTGQNFEKKTEESQKPILFSAPSLTGTTVETSKKECAFPYDIVFDETEFTTYLLELIKRAIYTLPHKPIVLLEDKVTMLNYVQEKRAQTENISQTGLKFSDAIELFRIRPKFIDNREEAEKGMMNFLESKYFPEDMRKKILDAILKGIDLDSKILKLQFNYLFKFDIKNINSILLGKGYPSSVAKILAKKLKNALDKVMAKSTLLKTEDIVNNLYELINDEGFSKEEKVIIKQELQGTLGTVFNKASQEECSALVIGIGTSGNAKQMCPDFLSSLRQNNQKPTMLNIDLDIQDNTDIIQQSQKLGFDLRYSSIDCLYENNFMYPILFKYIENYLTSSQKPLIITYYCNFYVPRLFVELAKKYPEEMNANRMILIHGYCHQQPMIVYSAAYLTSPNNYTLYDIGYAGKLEGAIYKGNEFNSREDLKNTIIEKAGKEAYENNRYFLNLGEIKELNTKLISPTAKK